MLGHLSNCGLWLHSAYISARWRSELPLVFTDKLRRAFVPNGMGGVIYIMLVEQHQAFGLIQP